MRLFLALLLSSIFILPLTAQSWTITAKDEIPEIGKRVIIPNNFIVSDLDDTRMKDLLWTAPDELKYNPNIDQKVSISVMLANGEMDQFDMVEYSMMEPGLAAKYPDIKTFHGSSTSNAFRKIRADYTAQGFRAVVSDLEGKTYIDHYQRGDKNHRIIYRKSDLTPEHGWECGVDTESREIQNDKSNSESRFSGDCVFRSYRLSVTATGEYSNYHDAFDSGDSGLVLSAITTSVNRINEVYEQDVTVRFILIENNDDIFYYDPATDPFNGTSASAMITQNQTNTDAVIGNANYDIGHIYSTGGSGLASLQSLCNTGSKARGVTGIGTPEGDPFDIDYVSHELGHQFGGNHTQNNSCNRNGSTAMEPGSASTIMGYAGICNPNVQNNSDAYFHAISIQEMNAEVTGEDCHGVIDLSNSAPVVDPLVSKSIPHSTPFVLDVVATDADGDVLNYCWEQMDNEVGAVMPPAGTNTQGPMFRSLTPVSDSKRYFPSIDNVIDDTDDQWEVLPTIGRDMDFRVTVRDNIFLPGCTDEADITITTVGSSGPFVVNSQNTSTTWLESQTVTITWDVAGTTASPISCSNVEILLSYDGGLTYPVTMTASTLNDGSADVVVPVGLTNQGRVMVKCADNVFFDINDSDIIIESGAPSYSIIADPSSGDACDNDAISFTLESTSILGYTDPITLSISGLPPGATANIATNPIIPGNSTLITIDDFDDQSGNYSVKVNGVAGSILRDVIYSLNVINLSTAPSLDAPADGETGVVVTPLLSWAASPGTIEYEYQVSSSTGGGNIISSGTTANTSVVSGDLNIATTYYWRVRSVNDCGTSAWSDEWTFTTGVCLTFSSTDIPVAIPVGTSTVTSEIIIKDKGLITGLNVVGLVGTHTWVSDLNFTLISPDNTERAFWSDPCGSQDNFNINFDDEANSSNYPCPPTDGQTYIPDVSLSVFGGKQLYSKWELEVFDDFVSEDGGSLNGWGIEVCLDDFCDLTVNDNSYVDSYGTLLSAINCAVDGDTIYLESTIANSMINTVDNTITITEDIVIIAEKIDNIGIISEAGSPAITIAAGAQVSLIGFNIENVDSDIGVLVNNGNLIIEDMNITFGTDYISVINNANATLTVKGDCNVIEE